MTEERKGIKDGESLKENKIVTTLKDMFEKLKKRKCEKEKDVWKHKGFLGIEVQFPRILH